MSTKAVRLKAIQVGRGVWIVLASNHDDMLLGDAHAVLIRTFMMTLETIKAKASKFHRETMGVFGMSLPTSNTIIEDSVASFQDRASPQPA